MGSSTVRREVVLPLRPPFISENFTETTGFGVLDTSDPTVVISFVILIYFVTNGDFWDPSGTEDKTRPDTVLECTSLRLIHDP